MPMTVGQLKILLSALPDDMEIINDRCSDYDHVETGDWSIVNAVPQGCSGYVMHSHPTMSAENKAKERQYLHLRGN